MRTRDLGEMALLGATWGASFPLLRVAAPQFGPVPLIAVRLIVAATIALALWRVFGELRKHAGKLFFLGLINTAVPFSMFAVAALYIPAGLNSLLNATTPMFAAVLAWAWLGERLTVLRVVGIAIAFVGVGLILSDSMVIDTQHLIDDRRVLGVLLGLVAAALYALAGCYVRRYMANLSPTVLSAGSISSAAMLMVPAAALFWPATMPSPGSWLAAFLLGAVCTALAYVLYFRLMAQVGAARASTVTFLIPVFGTLWGALFLGEQVTLRLAGYCLVVLVGTVLSTGLVRWPAMAAARSR